MDGIVVQQRHGGGQMVSCLGGDFELSSRGDLEVEKSTRCGGDIGVDVVFVPRG